MPQVVHLSLFPCSSEHSVMIAVRSKSGTNLYLDSRMNCCKQYSKVKVSVASQKKFFPTNQQFLLKYLLCHDGVLQKQEQGACCQHNQKTFWSLPRNCDEDEILDRLGCKCDATWLVVGCMQVNSTSLLYQSPSSSKSWRKAAPKPV